MITLSTFDLALSAALVLALAGAAFFWRLGVASQLLVAALRTALQLSLLGLVLTTLFGHVHPGLVALMALIMVLAAGREVRARQKLRLRGGWSYGLGTGAMFVSCFSLIIFALLAIIGPEPWYQPRYAIPLLGMLLGNTMNAVALTLDRLFSGLRDGRAIIEQRLLLGEDRRQATLELRRDALRAGLIPMINAMAAAGLVSLPGMMTGQILAGSPPAEAVKYQIFIMFLITASTGAGAMVAMAAGYRRLFDERDRLRLDRLSG